VGATLAAVARGGDLLPLQSTPEPERLHVRWRLPTPVTPDRLLTGLASFACAVAVALERRHVQGRTLEVRLRWETGASARISRTLAHPVADERPLAEMLGRMLTPPFQAAQVCEHHRAIEDLRLIISDLTPRYPAQHAFWPQRAKRLAATRELAAVLARRHGKPLLFHGVLAAPDAIFDQDRAHWVSMNADVADVADVLEGQKQGVARPPADVADAAETAETAEDIPHGIHWW